MTAVHTPPLRALVAQLNPCVGAVDANAERIAELMARAEAEGAHLLVTPELSLCGYPPEDLVGRADFVAYQREVLEGLAAASGRCATLVGFVAQGPARHVVDAVPRSLYNAVAVLRGGVVEAVEYKRRLPNYAVFDEARFFAPGEGPHLVLEAGGHQVGVVICEDLWDLDVMLEKVSGGAEVLVAVNASPWWRGREPDRLAVARHCGVPVLYVNQVGGQDGIVFDGDSFLVEDGALAWRAPAFAEATEMVEIGGRQGGAHEYFLWHRDDPDEIDAMTWDALCLGLLDYVHKNGFATVILGLSGGIDSALVATIALDALGPERVKGVLMPGPYSSEGSITDAEDLARRLGIETFFLPIAGPVEAVTAVLRGDAGSEGPADRRRHPFAGTPTGVAEENIQARLRGLYVLGLSNKFERSLVLTTGNHSELAVGYSTLAGDLTGGFSVIGDLPKTLVYRLARWRNAHPLGEDGPPIPERSITKPPSAELAPGQRDDAALPPYELLDAIIEAYVVEDRSPTQIAHDLAHAPRGASLRLESGEAAATVRRVVDLVDRAEYKRRQMPPTIKVTAKAFGRDRRLPITNAWRGRAEAAQALVPSAGVGEGSKAAAIGGAAA